MVSRTVCSLLVCLLVVASDAAAEDVVDVAASFIGRPYVWGAEGPDAFDCSGLTQYVFHQFGIDLPRRAINQSESGEPARRLRRGDMLFFSSDARQKIVTHVGIYEGSGTMIDASKRHGRVRRDDLSEPFWAARFMFARRIAADIARREDQRPGWPDGEVGSPRGGGDRRTAAVRALGRLAEGILRRTARR